MSGIHTTSGTPRPPPECPSLPAGYRELVTLTCGTLGYEIESPSADRLRIIIPVERRAAWDDQTEIWFDFDPSQTEASALALPSSTIAKLWVQLAEKSPAIHAAPVNQPVSVHQLTESIYAPFTVDNGRARLSGCSLEPRPYLRLTYATDQGPWKHVYFNEACEQIADDLVDRLGMRELEGISVSTANLPKARLSDWMEQATASSNGTSEVQHQGFPRATIVWCRYASGKLAFDIGEEEVTLNFAGWASDIASGYTAMPAYVCPLSGRQSRHISADDEGKITVAEAIAKCEVSGRRVVETELEICQQTGRHALKEYLATCEQTHRRVLKTLLQSCDMCQRKLAAVSLVKGRCEACRHLTPVSKDDPTLARLLHQYPKLDTWSKWRISETPQLFIFTAASWLQRLLLVVDKQSLEVHRIGTRNRFGSQWSDAPPKLREELTS